MIFNSSNLDWSECALFNAINIIWDIGEILLFSFCILHTGFYHYYYCSLFCYYLLSFFSPCSKENMVLCKKHSHSRSGGEKAKTKPSQSNKISSCSLGPCCDEERGRSRFSISSAPESKEKLFLQHQCLKHNHPWHKPPGLQRSPTTEQLKKKKQNK